MMRAEGLMRSCLKTYQTAIFVCILAAVSLAAGAEPMPASKPQPLEPAPEAARPAKTIKVAASIFPVTSIVKEIGDDRVALTTIVQPGSDPHEFEVTPATARAIDEADVVFYIAPSFDGWAIGSEKTGKASQSFEFAKIFGDSLIRTGRDVNPHFWLDPLFAKAMGRAVAGELGRIDPAGKAFFSARADTFSSRIDSLNARAKQQIRESGLKDYVGFHPAWTYFARRYGLNERGVLELTPEQEPSAKRIAGVLQTMKQYNIKFIFAEEFSNPVMARVMATDSNAKVLILDDLGGATRPGRDSYFALINYNVTKMVGAMREVNSGR